MCFWRLQGKWLRAFRCTPRTEVHIFVLVVFLNSPIPSPATQAAVSQKGQWPTPGGSGSVHPSLDGPAECQLCTLAAASRQPPGRRHLGFPVSVGVLCRCLICRAAGNASALSRTGFTSESCRFPAVVVVVFSCWVVSSSFATPWTVAHQASLIMGFPMQKYWNGLPFPSPGSLPAEDQTCVFCFGRQIPYHWATRDALPDVQIWVNGCLSKPQFAHLLNGDYCICLIRFLWGLNQLICLKSSTHRIHPENGSFCWNTFFDWIQKECLCLLIGQEVLWLQARS